MPGTLALIPARGGSKGLPRKNVLEFAGKPLIAWTILAARQAQAGLRVVVSTDSDEIAEVSRQYGAEVPFIRPPTLATDDASSFDVALHALDLVGGEIDSLLLLQPTSPLRTAADIDRAFQSFHLGIVNAVVSVAEAVEHPFLCYRETDEGTISPFCEDRGEDLRRQALPTAYVPNGAIYLVTIKALLDEKTFIPSRTRPLVMPANRSIDIDSIEDFKHAERQVQLV